MWKVLVAICLIGQPCTLFEEDPIKYYHSEKDFEDLLTFSEEEINEIYNEIFEMCK
jgi:hypothetical protein